MKSLTALILLAIGALSHPAYAAPPANDNLANATTISGISGGNSGTNLEATKEAGEPNHGGNAGGTSVWFNWTAPSTGSATIDTIGSGYDTTLAVYTGKALAESTFETAGNQEGWNWSGADTSVGASPAALFAPPSPTALKLNPQNTTNTAFLGNYTTKGVVTVEFDAMNPATHSDSLRLHAVLFNGPSFPNRWASNQFATIPNDGVWRHFTISLRESDMVLANGTATWAQVMAAVEGLSLRHQAAAAQAGGTALSSANNGVFLDNIRILNGTNADASTLELVQENDDIVPGTLQSTVTFPALAGKTYYIAVDGYDAETGNLTLNYSLGTPPVITSALAASGAQGSSFSYQIVATNSPTSFDATGLPLGLGVDPGTGLISGTPTESGSFNVSLSATNAGGTTTETLVLDIIPSVVANNAEDNSAGSLRRVIADLPAGSTVTFAPGLNNATITLDGTPILIDKNLTIDASSLADGVTLSGDGRSRVIEIASGGHVVVLDCLTITGGSTTGFGGGILNTGGVLTILRSTLRDNTAAFGGGLFNNEGSVTIDGSSIVENTTTTREGGGIYNQKSSSSAAVQSGIVNYWDFDGDLADSAAGLPDNASSVVDNGTFVGLNGTGGIGYGSGFLGTGGIEQDGAVGAQSNNGAVEVLRSADTLFGANATNPASSSTVTTSMWVSAAGFDTGWQTMLSHGEGSQYRIARRSVDVPEVAAYSGGSGDIPNPTGGPSIAAGTGWHHIVAISEGGVSTRLWVDGMLVATGAAPLINDAQGGGLLNLHIGANPDTGVQNREWWGEIDDVAQWNRVLSPEEISLIYNSGQAGIPLGAISEPGTMTITNSTIANNTAVAGIGGGIINFEGDLHLRNVTIFGNACDRVGGGLQQLGGSVVFENIILAGNTASLGGPDLNFQGAAEIIFAGVNLLGNNDRVQSTFPSGSPNGDGNLVGSSVAPLDAGLALLGDNGGRTATMLLVPGSPAIDASGSGPASDQRGIARPQGAAFDLGAVEVFPEPHHWHFATLPDGPVTSWVDRNFGVAAGLPLPENGDPVRNSSGVCFDGDDALTVATAGNPVLGLQEWSATVVFRADGALGEGGATKANGAPNSPFSWWSNSALVGLELPNQGPASGTDWLIGLNAEHEAVFGSGSSSPQGFVADGTAYNDATLHVMTGVFSRATGSRRLYIDGALVVDQATVMDRGPGETINFGCNILEVPSDRAYYTGKIQQVLLYAYARDEQDVLDQQVSLLSDGDNDGLSDGDEAEVYGTDPGNPDSDGDGLTDADEIFLYGTDPLNPDSDGDGWGDSIELAAGTNPNDSASGPDPAKTYAQDFTFPDGTTGSDLGDGSLIGSTGGARVLGNALLLTEDATTNTRSSFRIPSVPGSSSGWMASFEATLSDGALAFEPADGFSFNYGAIPARTGGGFGPDQDGTAEEGWGGGVNHISFEVDTWMNLDPEQGLTVAVNGSDLPGGFLNGPILGDGTAVRGTVTIAWTPTAVSFTTDGFLTDAAFKALVHGFAGDEAYRFAFSARTGGATEDLLIDNLYITCDQSIDRDNDGLSDIVELANGLDPHDDGSGDPNNGPNGDPDGDGLDNATEAALGNNLCNSDSDGDGLNDALEDSDGDGYSDGDEVNLFGTNPLDAGSFPAPPGLVVLGLANPTGLTIDVTDVPPGQAFHLREWLDGENFAPLAVPFDFDSSTVFPATIGVSAAANPTALYQIWLGSSPARTTIHAEDFDATDGGYVAELFNPLGAPGAGGAWTYGASGVAGSNAWSADGAEAGQVENVFFAFEQWLTSPVINVPTTGAVIVEFDHAYNFEPTFDGGVVMLSVNGGPFSQILAFVANGYNQTLVEDEYYPDGMHGLSVFGGNSGGFLRSVANLGMLNGGDTLQIRFRGGWDYSVINPSPNWAIDTIEVKQ